IAQAPASVSASFFRENSLTVAGHVTIDSSGGTSHLNQLNIESGGVLDLKNNSLVLEAGDLQQITAQIRSGLNTGTGIVSTAPGNPFRLGSMSNAGPRYTSFQGISGLNGDEVLIRYTRIGDLNYDGTVSISDFIDLASNFNQSVSGEILPISAADAAMLADFAAANGASYVPEPTCIVTAAVLGLLLSSRRRKLPLASLADCGVP